MKRIKPVPPQSVLRELFDYDGVNLRLRKDGSITGADNGNGYIRVSMRGQHFYAHRLIWMYVHGGNPLAEIDHRNRIRNDNRIDNLRSAGRKDNSGNLHLPSHNTSGIKGACWDKSRGKWIVHIKINGRQTFLGRFLSIKDASDAYDEAAREHFGEFALTNQDMAA